MEAGVFLDLVTRDQVAKVVRGIEDAVARSFAVDKQRQPILVVGRDLRITRDEVKRRSEICVRIFKELRGDLKWSVDRIVDQLPNFLRSELDGVSWKPDLKRNAWSPTGA